MRLPLVDGEVVAKASQRWLLPDLGGVYVFHDLRGALYIGQSCSVRRRFEEHLAGWGYGRLQEFMRDPIGVVKFSWFIIADSHERTMLERHLIRALSPAANRILYRRNA